MIVVLSLVGAQGLGEEVQHRILVGTFMLSSGSYSRYVSQAQRLRRAIVDEFSRVFRNVPIPRHALDADSDSAAAMGVESVNSGLEGVDILLTPTAPSCAPTFGELHRNIEQNPVSMFLNDVMTIPANLAGLPAVSVPAGTSNKVRSLRDRCLSSVCCRHIFNSFFVLSHAVTTCTGLSLGLAIDG